MGFVSSLSHLRVTIVRVNLGEEAGIMEGEGTVLLDEEGNIESGAFLDV